MSFGRRGGTGRGEWKSFYAAIIIRSEKAIRELEKRVAVLESEYVPLDQYAWIETTSGVRRMTLSLMPPEEKLRLGFRGLFPEWK